MRQCEKCWSEGYFKFEERSEIASNRLLARVRVESLLMEGARRIDEWTRLEARVPGAEAIPTLAPFKEGEAGPLELKPDEWEVLAEIDGQRDVGKIAATLQDEPVKVNGSFVHHLKAEKIEDLYMVCHYSAS